MNPLEDHPYLFTNGKFKAWINYEGCSFDINGLASDTKELLLEPDLGWYLAKDCTLIARPIEDMTDEEFERLSFVNKCIERQFFMNLLRSRTENDNLRFDDARVLISIGVYPFDQQHFGTGTVIDLNNK